MVLIGLEMKVNISALEHISIINTSSTTLNIDSIAKHGKLKDDRIINLIFKVIYGTIETV